MYPRTSHRKPMLLGPGTTRDQRLRVAASRRCYGRHAAGKQKVSAPPLSDPGGTIEIPDATPALIAEEMFQAAST